MKENKYTDLYFFENLNILLFNLAKKIIVVDDKKLEIIPTSVLNFIKSKQDLGATMSEIKEFLGLSKNARNDKIIFEHIMPHANELQIVHVNKRSQDVIVHKDYF